MSRFFTLIIALLFTLLNGLATSTSASASETNPHSFAINFSSIDYLIYDPIEGILYLPAVEVVNASGGVDVYQMQLYALDNRDNPTLFELNDVTLQQEMIGKPVRYQPETGLLELPEVYFAEQSQPRALILSWIPNTEPAQFSSIPSAADTVPSSDSSSESTNRQPFDPATFNPLNDSGKKENVAPESD